MKNTSNKNIQTAFTLAEILIALTIIGVIAAITVPALIQRTNKQEYVSALQKAYSTLSQVTNQIIAENGSPKTDENGETWLKDAESMYNMYKKHLINVKDCGSAAGCYELSSIRYLNNNIDGNWNITSGRRLILADGVQVLFGWIYKTCNHTTGGGSTNSCAEIFVDVNGAKKPNTWGRDVFGFVLKENGLHPVGCDNNSSDCIKTGSGYGCACKVLREGAMNY